MNVRELIQELLKVAEPRERTTNLFYGYEWMIESILKNGEIV